ncbi:hypothetical protein COJ01_17310 [Priestia megaterium]|uniref:hypothetical protein n=1 Tax=Priestia megaterium TaxID=1404 RepID=UPI000BF3C3D0|nr:hypothetical protein [Priestia megaterium]PFK99829.1 hypothetical protein COJ01_17310 [Priestia megaterium]
MIKKIDSLLFDFTEGKTLAIWTCVLLLAVLATSLEISKGIFELGGFTTWFDLWAFFTWFVVLHLFKTSMKEK